MMVSTRPHNFDSNESFQWMADAGPAYFSPRTSFLHHQHNEGRRDSLASTQSCTGLSFASSTDYSSPDGAMSGPPTCAQSPIPQENLVEVMSYEADPLHSMPLLEHHRTFTPGCGTEDLYNNFVMAAHSMSMHPGPISYTSVGLSGLASPVQHPPVTHGMELMDMHTSGGAWEPVAVNSWPPTGYHHVEENDHPSAPWVPFQTITSSPHETMLPGSSINVEEFMVPLGYMKSPESSSEETLPTFKCTPRRPTYQHGRRSGKIQKRPTPQARKSAAARTRVSKYETHQVMIDVKTEEKSQHVCKYPGCNKRFKRQEHRKRHYDTHLGLIVAKCPMPKCNKDFGRNDNFIAHMKTHLPKQGRHKNPHFTFEQICKRLGNPKVIEKLRAEVGDFAE